MKNTKGNKIQKLNTNTVFAVMNKIRSTVSCMMAQLLAEVELFFWELPTVAEIHFFRWGGGGKAS
jgi:hypothetical protein